MSRQAGLHVRETRRAKSTGALISCTDALHPDDTDFRADAEEGVGRWVAFCETHKTFVHHTSWRTARSFIPVPEQWCDGCKEIVESGRGPDPHADPFTPEQRRRAQEERARRAAERAAAKEEAKRAKQKARTLEEQWSRFGLEKPLLVDNSWTEEERLIVNGLKLAQLRAQRFLREARLEQLRLGREVEELREERKPEPKERRRLRELEARDRELEARIEEAEAVAVSCRAERDRLANLTWLRGALEYGLRVERNGSGPVLLGAGEPVRLPDDFLSPEDLREVTQVNVVEQKLLRLSEMAGEEQVTIHTVEDGADPDFFCVHPRSDPEEGYGGKTLEEALDRAIVAEHARDQRETAPWN